ncbi:hypothetical protein BDP55DRAFT_668761 [Colletotrichum godetiae]|uniref:Uncharacterized protein n=1 Tax=Colletotrichum godetiae TaxID=1209918 RepID=A0AAJ0AIT0_9PEZI|nr:uncharacterized protein BDP55DRAFT_668761 [Colletotrichum godetiae]KAK1674000.1 hypothetical protein BDP55DRAFT_668761 [Colletotrichum godetiae]
MVLPSRFFRVSHVPLHLLCRDAHQQLLSSTVVNFELHLPHPPHIRYVSTVMGNEERTNTSKLPRQIFYPQVLT